MFVQSVPLVPSVADAPASLDACRRCGLWEHATHPVPGAGPGDARIMLVGEQPGDRDDRAGAPFGGPAGELLDRALADARLDRKRLYLTNAVKHFSWKPSGKRRLNRAPTRQEVIACRHWLERELDTIRPSVIVALGVIALRAIVQDDEASLHVSASVVTVLPHARGYVVATCDPFYVLRTRGADARERAYDALVDALRTAARLAQRPAAE